MSIALRARGVRAVVLDIEGTTTPIAFVYDVLFPFARIHLHEFLQNPVNADALREPLERLREEWLADPGSGGRPAAGDGGWAASYV